MDFTLFAQLNDFMDLWEVARVFGPWALAVAFFIWRDSKREDRLSARINYLENEQRDTILPLVTNCTEVITQNTEVMKRLEKALDKVGH